MENIKFHKVPRLSTIDNSEQAFINTTEDVVSRLSLSSESNSYFNTLYTRNVLSFMQDYRILDKYKVTVFIEGSQSDVYYKTEEPISGKKKIMPNAEEIYIWLVRKNDDYTIYDTSFIKVQLGISVAREFKKEKVTQSDLEDFILRQIKDTLGFNPYRDKAVSKASRRGIADVFLRISILDDLTSDPLLKEIYETNPALYMAIKASDYAAQGIENLKLNENRWNPRAKNFNPLIKGSTKDNAMICGIVNGIIQQVKAIPELAKLVSTFLGSEDEWKKFKEAMVKLFSDEEVQKALIDAITKDYKDSIETGNIEKLFYKMAYDAVTVVTILIGLYGLVKGIVGFIKFIRKAFLYIRRYGIKSVAKLKQLGKKSIIEIFDRLETGSGGFYKYKRILSRDMVKQEEWMSCAAACIKRYADDLGIKISEAQIRTIAKTSESGTDGKDIYLAMRKIFKDKNVFAKSYFDDIDDIKNFNTMLADAGGEKFITNVGRYPNKHTIIVNRIDGDEVFIRDPWPLEVDKAFEKGVRGVELEKIFEQSEKGVQAVLDIKEFQSLWAQGGNIMFKIN